jgi:long-chain acyl-CoA synthetase
MFSTVSKIIKWSCPREVEFLDKLPLTKIGKVNFRALEALEHEKRK